MKREILYLLISVITIIRSFGAGNTGKPDEKPVNDGPYFVKVLDNIIVRWIENGQFREKFISQGSFPEIRRSFNLSFSYDDLIDSYSVRPDFRQSYKRVDSISVITDTHGEFETYIRLLKANRIIDQNLRWSFGHGHLVVLGDIFDRGDKVTEILWHLFGLEKQASDAGGKVHLLLGNHELMILGNEPGYINSKYRAVERISGMSYPGIYSPNSVLGNWLRTRPVMISINDVLFVHAGISMELVKNNLKVKNVNSIFSNIILGNKNQKAKDTETLSLLTGEQGPLWYRGYFKDSGFCESKIDSILTFYNKKHIVVGHTPAKTTMTLFNTKIIGADTGIMYDLPGEMIIYKKGTFYKACPYGSRTRL